MEASDFKVMVKMEVEVFDKKPYLEQADLQWTDYVKRTSPRKLNASELAGNQSSSKDNSAEACKNSEERSKLKKECDDNMTMTEEAKRREKLAATRERDRSRKKKARANRTEEEREKLREKNILYKRRARSRRTEEELIAIREKNRLYRRRVRSKRTEEELIAIREKDKLKKRKLRLQRKENPETQEEMEERLQKGRVRQKQLRERDKEVRQGDPEKRQKFRDRTKRLYYKKMDKLKEGGGEGYQKHLEYYRKYFATQTPEQRWKRLQGLKVNQAVGRLKVQMRKEGVSEEEINVCADALKAEMELKSEPMPPPETISEYKPRQWTNLGRPRAKNTANETPEQKRWKKLQAYKVYQAVGKLKKKMRKEGISEEEIQVCADALKAEMEMKCEPMPLPDKISEYKPRPRKNLGKTQSQVMTTTPLSQPTNTEVECHGNWKPKEKPLELIFNVQNAEEEETGGDLGNDLFSPANSPQSTYESSLTQLGENVEDHPMETDAEVDVEPKQSTQPSSQSLFPATDKNAIRDYCIPISAHVVPEESSAIFDLTTSEPLENLKCPKCKAPMASYRKFLAHYKDYHSKENSKCEIFNKASSTTMINKNTSGLAHEQDIISAAKIAKPTLAKLRKKLDFLCLKCPVKESEGIVGISFDTSKDLLKHVKMTHPKYFWPCPHCKLLKYHKSSIDKHVEMCRKYFICEDNKKRGS